MKAVKYMGIVALNRIDEFLIALIESTEGTIRFNSTCGTCYTEHKACLHLKHSNKHLNMCQDCLRKLGLFLEVSKPVFLFKGDYVPVPCSLCGASRGKPYFTNATPVHFKVRGIGKTLEVKGEVILCEACASYY